MSRNPYAFPFADSVEHNAATGMTLRDWFAGQAICGVLSGDVDSNNFIHNIGPRAAAAWAYRFADAMLAERDKEADNA